MVVGITGGIGSGKSIVCRLFGCLNIPVYDADSRAKWLTNHDPEIRKNVTALLGEDSYTASGEYNRPFVASQVFGNADLLAKLNNIIHPAVQQDTDSWIKKHSHYPYLIKEAALMNKAGHHNNLDYVIVVDAPVDLRVKRVLVRDNRSEEEIRNIIARQVSDDERRQIADFIVHNDEDSALIPQILALHQNLLSKIS